jgi:hypothetical protein
MRFSPKNTVSLGVFPLMAVTKNDQTIVAENTTHQSRCYIMQAVVISLLDADCYGNANVQHLLPWL